MAIPPQDIKTLGELYDAIKWPNEEKVLEDWYAAQGKEYEADSNPLHTKKFRCAMMESAIWGDPDEAYDDDAEADAEANARQINARHLLDRAGVWGQISKIMVSIGLANEEDCKVKKPE